MHLLKNACKKLKQRHAAALGADEVLLAHLAHLAHHGAAVGADVVGKHAEGKRQGERPAAVLVGELLEKAQQLFADGAAGRASSTRRLRCRDFFESSWKRFVTT